MTVEFAASALRELSKLDIQTQKRIARKLNFYASQKQPLRFAEKLTDSRFGQWRFRIGSYRVLFDIEGQRILVVAVGHRREIYD
jgi:mRNA interferase RelE/StbE